MIYSAWSLNNVLKSAWQNVAGFKAAFWRGTSIALSGYIVVGITAIIWLLFAKNSLVILIIGSAWFALGLVFIYMPLQVGVLRLSLDWLNKKPIQLNNVYRYLNMALALKIGLVTLLGIFFIAVTSCIPTWWGQVIGFVAGLFILATMMLAWFYLADTDPNMDHVIAFCAFSLKYRGLKLAMLMLLSNIVFLLSLLTLGIAFIWLGPWFNHAWALVYLNIKAQYQIAISTRRT